MSFLIRGSGSSELLDSREECDLADVSIHTAHSDEMEVVKRDAVGYSIEKALNTKIKLRQRLARIEHHLKFLII